MDRKKYKKEYIDIERDERFSMERVVSLLCLTKVSTRTPKNGNILYKCPLCGDSDKEGHGHLYIDLLKNGYYCARCGESGKALSLYAKVQGIDNKTAFKELLGNEINKKERKKIHNLKVEKKIMIKNKESETTILAGIKRRDQVYRALLDELYLIDTHKNDLLRRGLTEKVIKKIGYKSIATNKEERKIIAHTLIRKGYKLSGIPGFYKDIEDNKWTFTGYAGYLVPVFDYRNRIQAFQIRRFVTKGKYIWFSSSGEKEGTAAETFVNFTSLDYNKPFVIVEGLLKSQVCSFLKPSANYIGIPGTFAIRFLINELIERNIKKVFIAFDMDKLTNSYVQKAELNLKKDLTNNGIAYEVFEWNIQQGKGLDDFLFFKLLQNTTRAGGFVYCG